MKFSMNVCPKGQLTNAQLLMIKGGNDQTDNKDTVIQDDVFG